jgi:hypothetical protein
MELHSIWLIATIADDLLIVEGERERKLHKQYGFDWLVALVLHCNRGYAAYSMTRQCNLLLFGSP